MTPTPTATSDYIQIEGVGNSKFRVVFPSTERCDIFTVPWKDFGSMVADIIERTLDERDEDDNQEVTLKFTLLRLTDEEFTNICEGGNE